MTGANHPYRLILVTAYAQAYRRGQHARPGRSCLPGPHRGPGIPPPPR